MGRDARGADVVAPQGPCGPPNRKKNRWTASAFMLTRAPIDQKKTGGPLLSGVQRSSTQKKNTKNHFYIPLVLAPHQKDEEEPRCVNNKHDEAYRVLPREMVRRP